MQRGGSPLAITSDVIGGRPLAARRGASIDCDAKFAFVAEASDPSGRHVRVISGWHDGDWMDQPFEYDTEGKPCALVVERAVVAFPSALTKRFPNARPAIEMGLESYLAVCLRAADGTHLGHMAVMDARPMAAGDDDIAAMRIFASRTAAELERRRQAAALRGSRARVIEAADAERRRVGRDLHPVALAERGLRSALESLTVGCPFDVRLDVAAGELPDDLELAAYFIVSESLTNARRYADAGEVSVRITPEGDTLVVEIADDGAGGADPARGTGLRGLADRIEALDGAFEVHSPPGAGTRVGARLPLTTAGG